jgi:putative transposase
MITHRPKRLPGVSYAGLQRYSVTICTAFRHAVFTDEIVTAGCMLQLRHSATLHQFALVAYCFMPDHVHVLVYGTSERSELPVFIARYKQLTGFQFRRQVGRGLWQPGYYERILRDNESTTLVARYILGNPVRAGLAKCIGEYPFAGSDVYDVPALASAWD